LEALKRGDIDCELLISDIKNIAMHWARDHSFCAYVNAERKCIRNKWGADRAYLKKNSPSYNALEAWLASHITSAKMQYYIKARENYLSETFHSLINKYASKQIHWRKCHYARLACAAMDWNENRDRECLHVVTRKSSSSAVRRRSSKQHLLAEKTFTWKKELALKLFG
jgi:hypothetical protein